MIGRTMGVALAAAVAVVAIAPAGTDWLDGKGVRGAMADLAAAYAWGAVCNKTPRREVATRFLQARLGSFYRYGPGEIADMMQMAASTREALQMLLADLSPAGVARVCTNQARRFGPQGSAIAGLWE